MSSTWRNFVGAALCALLATSFACGGDDDDETPDPTATVEDATSAPGESPTPAEEDDTPDPDAVPTFEAGAWTGGELELTISTTQERTISGTLLDRSSSEGGTTRLIFADDLDTVNISISTEFEAFAVSASQDTFRAVSSFDEPCTVTYAEATETRIEGTFRCENVRVESFEHEGEGPATFEGSFTATR